MIGYNQLAGGPRGHGHSYDHHELGEGGPVYTTLDPFWPSVASSIHSQHHYDLDISPHYPPSHGVYLI